jgi:hypothetical protein
MNSIGVEGTVAFVRPHFAASGAKELAVLEVPPKCVEFVVSFHGLDVTSRSTESMD